MPTYYSKQVVTEVDKLLQTPVSEQPVIVTWKKILVVLKREGIVKEKRLLHPRRILAHPKNRGGLMLNGFNVRANGSKVAKVGANRSELHGATVIEMSPFSATSKEQIEENVKLAEKSGGLIPPPTGEEQFLSLATSHMVCFIRCVLAGLKAGFTNIGDDNGNLSAELLSRDPEYEAMLREGWEFDIIPWQCEATWPLLPEFSQRALNAANAVATDATEWEVAVNLGECFASMEEPNWALAEASACAGDPQCSSYIGKVRLFVEKYGGGAPTFSMIHEQESFYKTLGSTKRLGQSFTSAIVDVRLHETDPYVHVRHALVALNLTSTKLEDGVVKFVTKSHITGLAAKEKRQMVHTANAELRDARSFLLDLVKNNKIGEAQNVELLGLLRIRYGGFMTKLGKASFINHEYESSHAVIEVFLQEVTKAMKSYAAENDTSGDPVPIPASLKHGLEPITKKADEPKNEPKKTDVALTADEASSYEQQAREKGFEQGRLAIMKKSEAKRLTGIFRITTIGETCVLGESDCFKDDKALIATNVPFSGFITKWVPYKGDVPCMVNGNWSVPLAPEVELKKADLFKEINGLVQDNEDPALNSLIVPCFKPHGLRAATDLKKGKLILYPVCNSLSQIGTRAADSATPVPAVGVKTNDGKPLVFYISHMTKPANEVTSKWKGTGISPVSWLIEAEDADVNMVRKEFEQGGFKIPYYENSKIIKQHQRIVVAKGTLKRKADVIS